MKRPGAHPAHRPSGLHDRAVAGSLAALYWLLFAPLTLVTAALGWTRLDWLLLDLLSIPGSVLRRAARRIGAGPDGWALKVNAYAHIFLVCRLCPASRQALRDPDHAGRCVWNHRWNHGEFRIEPDFGARNWMMQYRGRTDLSEYEHLSVAGDAAATSASPRFTGVRWIVSLVANAVLLGLLVWIVMYWSFLTSGLFALRGTWEQLTEVPEAENHYPPQGLTRVDDKLVFTNHWKDTKSAMYLMDLETMEVLDETEMPPEAVHTSGLAWDGESLWAVDYKSNRLYVIDLAASFEGDEVVVRESYPTGLGGTSAMTLVDVDGVDYMAISDFMRTGLTYLVPKADAPKLADHPIADLAVATYKNRGFSQGLTWDGTFLYETSNSLGRDCVHVYRVDEAIRSNGAEKVDYVGRIKGPVSFLEDLATDGERMWTSSERAYHFYVLTDLAALRERLQD
jgi:glutamine cyclotransferase